MTPGEWAAIITSLGGGLILRDLGGWIGRSVTGREKRRRDDAHKAWAAYRRVKRKFHRLEDAYALARRMLFAADCIDPKTIPPWPDIDTTDLETKND